MRALGVYIFAGGFTVGVKRAGFDVAAHLEDGPFGVATSKRNHPGLDVFTDPASWPLALFKGGVDFVYGNPPCAPWSQAGMSPKHKRGLADRWYERDPRVGCVYQMFDVLEKVRPHVWAWESVARAATAGRDLIDSLAARAAALGYACTLVLVNGADAGVPQDRKRVFVVFHDVVIPWTAPIVPRVTVREALAGVESGPGDHPPFPPSYRELLPKVAPGGSLAITFNQLHGTTYEPGTRVKGRPAFLYRRLTWDQLAFTTTGDPKHFHPDEPRLLTAPEQAAVCGYPKDYVFEGSLRLRFEQMSKAVLPAAGEWLARNVRAGLEAAAPVAVATNVVDFIASSPATLTTGGTRSVTKASLPRTSKNVVRRVAAQLGEAIPDLTSYVPLVVARPKQESALPVWETFSGPTALARVLIAEGHDDGPILAATSEAIRGAKAAAAQWPHLFTRTDLQRLRARIEKTGPVVVVTT